MKMECCNLILGSGPRISPGLRVKWPTVRGPVLLRSSGVGVRMTPERGEGRG